MFKKAICLMLGVVSSAPLAAGRAPVKAGSWSDAWAAAEFYTNRPGSATSNSEPRPEGADQNPEKALACKPSALDPAGRARARQLVGQIRSNNQGAMELPNGYAILLAQTASAIRDAAECIALERLCCPFFDFVLQSEREGGPVWLKLFGRDGVKEVAKLEFNLHPGASLDVARSSIETPLVCNDKALDATQRQRLGTLLDSFRTARTETRELADGYAVRLPGSAPMIGEVAEYMTLVRQCSPYLDVALEVECDGGPVWLKITGRKGVKELARTELQI